MLYRDYDEEDDRAKFRTINQFVGQRVPGLDVKAIVDASIGAGNDVETVSFDVAQRLGENHLALGEGGVDFALQYIEKHIALRDGKCLYTKILRDYREQNFDAELWKRVYESGVPFFVDTLYDGTTIRAGLLDADGSVCELRVQQVENYLLVSTDFYREDKKRFLHSGTLFLDCTAEDTVYMSFADESLNNRDLPRVEDSGRTIRVRKRKLSKMLEGYYLDPEMVYVADVLLCLQGVLRTYFSTLEHKKTRVSTRTSKPHEPSVEQAQSKLLVKAEKNSLVPLSRLQYSYGGKRVAKGGHHNSPVPHSVSGHWRHYKNKTVWIEGFYKPSKKYSGQQVSRFLDVDR